MPTSRMGRHHLDVLAEAIELMRTLRNDAVEHLSGDRDEIGVGNPHAIDPSPASRSLSLRTCAMAFSLIAGSRRLGTNAAIP
jgi:hypothetical protein